MQPQRERPLAMAKTYSKVNIFSAIQTQELHLTAITRLLQAQLSHIKHFGEGVTLQCAWCLSHVLGSLDKGDDIQNNSKLLKILINLYNCPP